MKRSLVAVAVALLACAGLTSAGDAKKDLEMLQGNWTAQSIKDSGQKDQPADLTKLWAASVKGDIMRLTYKGDTRSTLKIKLDATKSPKFADFTHEDGPDKGKAELGIYKIEGDTLTICWNVAGAKDRPAAFATKDGTKFSLWVLKKAK